MTRTVFALLAVSILATIGVTVAPAYFMVSQPSLSDLRNIPQWIDWAWLACAYVAVGTAILALQLDKRGFLAQSRL